MSAEGVDGRSFMELYVSGERLAEELDDAAAAWKAGAGQGAMLREWLGMSEEEHDAWTADPGCLPMIATARKYGRPLGDVLSERTAKAGTTVLMSPSLDGASRAKVREWLETRGMPEAAAAVAASPHRGRRG